MHHAGRAHTAGRASSPTARAASRRSIACRSAPKARRACCRPIAAIDFYRGVPPGGFTKGLPAHLRTDKGDGDIPPEVRGTHFFAYKPYHLAVAPPRPALAKATNDMQALVSSGDYDGVIWTQGSPQVEESAYWFNLLIDTTLPICGNAAQRPQGQISADGPANIVDSVALHPVAASGPTSRAATAAASW